MFIFIPHNTAYCIQTDMFAMAIATFYLHNNIQVRNKMPCLSNKTAQVKKWRSHQLPRIGSWHNELLLSRIRLYNMYARARKSGLTLTRPSLTQQESSNPKPTDNTKGRPYSMGQPCANGWFGVENKAKCILICTLRTCKKSLLPS